MSDIVTVTLNPALDVSTAAPRISPVHKLRCAHERRDPGGGGINVARVISRLGGDVTAVFPAGGPIGDYLQLLLREEGVRSRAVPIAGVTRESFTVLEQETNNEYRFVLPGPALTPAEFEACLAALDQTSAWLIASGSLPPGAPADAYAQLAKTAQQRGARFVLDASGEALRLALAQGVHLVKPNLRELQDMLGAPLQDEASMLAAARALVHKGQAEIVALSRGANGALLVTADEAWTAEAVDVPIVSSVGAGDSFLGALVWSLARGDGLETAFRHALAGGAAALLRPGTELCTRADVMRLAELARPRRL
jgi:6-phosphofructokinase 2